MSNEFELNEEQQKLLKAPEKRVLGVAGPGTGKTIVFVHRVCKEIRQNAGRDKAVCALTFTNAATDVIRNRLTKTGHSAEFPNFLGTIDTFLLQHIVQPYAAAAGWVPKGGVRLLAGDQETQLHQPECRLDEHHNKTSIYKFCFCGGSLDEPIFHVRTKQGRSVRLDSGQYRDEALRTKEKDVWEKHGLMTHSDCAYVAARLLTEGEWRHRIAAGFGARFSSLLIDEAQDIGTFRLKALLDLAERSNVDVFLVGDPDQAIYQFRGATPSQLNGLKQQRHFDEYPIPKTYRFGQSICDASEAFSTQSIRTLEPKDPDTEDQAELYYHDWRPSEDGAFDALLEWLNREVQENESAAVLARKNKTLDYIRYGRDLGETKNITPFERHGINLFADAIVLIRAGQPAAGRDKLTSAVSHYVLGQANPSHETLANAGLDRTGWRAWVWKIGLALSEFGQENTWNDWHSELRERLQNLKDQFPKDLQEQKRLSSQFARHIKDGRSRDEPCTIRQVTFDEERNWPAGTNFLSVHAAKGQEFNVVAYVAPIGVHNSRKAPTAWSESTDLEDLCVAYVACSRAKRALRVFVHDDYRGEMEEKCGQIVEAFEVVDA
jgi:DNA helicase-2/ATP-dependent DNA helicase PcrA